MTRSVLFLSHAPHATHRAFAETVGARTYLIPFAGFVRAMKVSPLLRLLYPFCTFFFGLAVPARENILLVEGGSALFVALGLKIRRPSRRLIYLDADLLFYDLAHSPKWKARIWHLLLHYVDGVITVSDLNRQYIDLDVPIRICPPFPRSLPYEKTTRSESGLYVGRIDPEKCVERVIDVTLGCSILPHLYIIGDGVQHTQIADTAQTQRKLTYLGRRTDVARFYYSCTFFIHLPDHDPHPVTTMEAALCGCFPLISRGTGTAYLFDALFIIDDPDDSKEICAKMQYIHEHRDEAIAKLRDSVARFPTKNTALARFKTVFAALVEDHE